MSSQSQSPDGPDSPVDELYCLCRGRSDGRLMIQCEQCDDWFHAECVQVTRIDARSIEKFFCPPCLSQHSHLTIVYKESFLMRKSRLAPDYNDSTADDIGPSTSRCGECIGCFRESNCAKCDGCLAGKACEKKECIQPRVTQKAPPERKKQRKQKMESDDDNEVFVNLQLDTPEKNSKRGRKIGSKSKKQSPSKKALHGIVKEQHRVSFASTSYMPSDAFSGTTFNQPRGKRSHNLPPQPRQCHNIDCIYQARENSKYCSEECGLALAELRLKTLPNRLLEYWEARPEEIAKNEQKEKQLKEEMLEVTLENDKVTKWIGMLMNYVEAIKTLRSDEVEEVVDGTEGETMVGCPVCAVEHPSRTIFKHIERCFVRQEKQVTYGAPAASQIAGKIFCDTQNKDGSFCLRLRVMCPEHYKGEIENDIEICGCPKIWNDDISSNFSVLFSSAESLLSKGMCNVARKSCTIHHKWLQMILALLDGTRQQILIRISDIFAERKAIGEIVNGDAILLMTNQTTYHGPLKDIVNDYNTTEEKINRIMK